MHRSTPSIYYSYLFLLFLLPVSSHAQSWPQTTRLDSLFLALDQYDRGTGSLSIYRDGVELYANANGYLENEGKSRVTPRTRYRIGSISKTFTAVILLRLAEEGLLKLDAPLSDYFPQVPNAKAITLEMLLRHNSGIHSFTNDDEYEELILQPITRDSLIALIAASPPDFAPGQGEVYSNAAYILATFVAERASGKPYPALLEEYITVPLQLPDTYYGGPIDPARREIRSFKKVYGEWVADTETDMSLPQGAGGIVSTAGDVNAFYHALFTGKLLSETSLSKMREDPTPGMRMGLFAFPYNEKQALGHTGGIDGFRSMTGHFPEEGITLTYLTNAEDYRLNNIMLYALGLLFDPATTTLPDLTPPRPLDEAIMAKYVGTYTSPTFPLDLTVTYDAGQLKAQATGQPAFPLEAAGEHTFTFEPAGVRLVFDPDTATVVLYQGGMEVRFSQ